MRNVSLLIVCLLCVCVQDWQPPFACDVDRLHFTPRIQRLNELEVILQFCFELENTLYKLAYICEGPIF